MMLFSRVLRPLRIISAFLVATFALSTGAGAQTIIDEWNTAPAPPAPTLKAAALDSKTTALLVLDFLKQNCAPRPRCTGSLPQVKGLLTSARAKGMLVVYSAFPGATIADTLPEVAPLPGEPSVLTAADKFLNTDLDQLLKARGIKTIIVTGTAANGAALYTASTAALRGYAVVVPIDCIPGATPYIEQFVTYQLANAPTIANHVTLTRSGTITF